MDNIKVGIGFVTGRKSFRDVLTTYMNNWGICAMSDADSVELNLFVAYDLDYQNTNKDDYTNIRIDVRERLSNIHFIGPKSIRKDTEELVNMKVATRGEIKLIFEKEYAGKRNAVLYSAIKHGMDYLLFLDDDEYPLAVQKNSDTEMWMGQQVLSTHLKNIEDADITNGHHCGYISPIPNIEFDELLREDDFKLFTEAISNDIISWDSIKKLQQQGNVTYAETKIMTL